MWWAQLLNNIVSLLGNGGGAANSFESIATSTVGAGGVSSITFSSIPSTYKHLQIRALHKNSSGVYWMLAQLNSDTAANYSYHDIYGSGTAVTAEAGASASYMNTVLEGTEWGNAVIDILDYADGNKYKTIRSLGGYDANGSGYVDLASGNWRSTSAVSTIKLYPYSGNFAQYSSFALYGVK